MIIYIHPEFRRSMDLEHPPHGPLRQKNNRHRMNLATPTSNKTTPNKSRKNHTLTWICQKKDIMSVTHTYSPYSGYSLRHTHIGTQKTEAYYMTYYAVSYLSYPHPPLQHR